MLEVMECLRSNGFRTYIVTGGGQDFVRAYAQQAYGIPLETSSALRSRPHYTYTKEGQGHPDAAPEAAAEQ